jgi:hypothetical protein
LRSIKTTQPDGVEDDEDDFHDALESLDG